MPPQHGAHPRNELAWVERLSEIVVGPDLKTDDAVNVFFKAVSKMMGTFER